MPDIKFETGKVTYTINGDTQVSFNPTDSAFVEKLFGAFDTLDKRQDAYKAEVEKVGDKREIFDVARKRDTEMREIIDSVFDAPVCEALFGEMNVYAMADGLPAWANLMLAVMDEIDTSFAKQKKLTDPRISKYLARYHK